MRNAFISLVKQQKASDNIANVGALLSLFGTQFQIFLIWANTQIKSLSNGHVQEMARKLYIIQQQFLYNLENNRKYQEH